jgi:predicted O-methyltransferase YrrM
MKGLTVTGSWTFCGAKMAQNELVMPMFRILLSKISTPLRIIELGTYQGALTWFLYQVAPKGTDIRTFDVKEQVPVLMRSGFKKAGILYSNTDVFLTYGRHEEPVLERLLRDTSVTTMLLCDNGNKVKEVNTFAPFMKKGDIIMCHDYAFSAQESHDELYGRYWNHCEVRYDQIGETLQEQSFEEYERELTKYAAWGCFRKVC